MNSKNFNAAEKHFEKKRVQMQKRFDECDAFCTKLRFERADLQGEIKTLQADLEQRKEWIDRLLTYTELDIEDIKKACEKDKQVADTFKALNSLSGYFGGMI